MKAHIVTLVIIDFNGLGPNGIKTELQAAHFGNDSVFIPNVMDIQTHDIGEWDDSHPLNQCGTDQLAWLRKHGQMVQELNS
jgi:hypothetical protein